MHYSFDTTIAKDFDVDTAIFLENLKFWTFINLSNNKNIRDGHCWMYNTLSALVDQFPFWNKRSLERVINNCVDSGLIIKGNYNKKGYDRTTWYALTAQSYQYFPELCTDKYLRALFDTISRNGEMDFTEWGNAFHGSVTPIPDTLPTDVLKERDNNNAREVVPPKTSNIVSLPWRSDYYTEMLTLPDETVPTQEESNESFDVFFSAYPVKKSENVARAMWHAQKCNNKAYMIIEKLLKQVAEDVQYIDGYPPSITKYIGEERWNDEIQKRPKRQAFGKPVLDHNCDKWARNIEKDFL